VYSDVITTVPELLHDQSCDIVTQSLSLFLLPSQGGFYVCMFVWLSVVRILKKYDFHEIWHKSSESWK